MESRVDTIPLATIGFSQFRAEGRLLKLTVLGSSDTKVRPLKKDTGGYSSNFRKDSERSFKNVGTPTFAYWEGSVPRPTSGAPPRRTKTRHPVYPFREPQVEVGVAHDRQGLSRVQGSSSLVVGVGDIRGRTRTIWGWMSCRF